MALPFGKSGSGIVNCCHFDVCFSGGRRLMSVVEEESTRTQPYAAPWDSSKRGLQSSPRPELAGDVGRSKRQPSRPAHSNLLIVLNLGINLS